MPATLTGSIRVSALYRAGDGMFRASCRNQRRQGRQRSRQNNRRVGHGDEELVALPHGRGRVSESVLPQVNISTAAKRSGQGPAIRIIEMGPECHGNGSNVIVNRCMQVAAQEIACELSAQLLVSSGRPVAGPLVLKDRADKTNRGRSVPIVQAGTPASLLGHRPPRCNSEEPDFGRTMGKARRGAPTPRRRRSLRPLQRNWLLE